MMHRLVGALLMVFVAAQSFAQGEPQVSVEFEQTETLVGQPLVLRIKVLVPTWMPSPPQFPTLEVPGVMVRLPERASSPTSETIDGETWSGVQRAYRLYPLAPGTYTIPAQEIRITMADPGQTDPIMVTVPTPEISLRAGLPAEASDLDPPVIATGFTLEQSIDGATDLAPGDAVTRTITARIAGTTPVLIPPLTPDIDAANLRSYPSDPAVSESEDRGVLSGQRIEKTTYVAQGEGTVALPEVVIEWFNTESNAIETATLPGADLTVTGGTSADNPAADLDLRTIVYGLAIFLVVALIARWAIPHVRRWLRNRQEARRASEAFAYRKAVQALDAMDLSLVFATLDDWAGFFPELNVADLAPVETALTEIGRRTYGPDENSAARDNWIRAKDAFRALRKNATHRQKELGRADMLPPLNVLQTPQNRRA